MHNIFRQFIFVRFFNKPFNEIKSNWNRQNLNITLILQIFSINFVTCVSVTFKKVSNKSKKCGRCPVVFTRFTNFFLDNFNVLEIFPLPNKSVVTEHRVSLKLAVFSTGMGCNTSKRSNILFISFTSKTTSSAETFSVLLNAQTSSRL
jgi:hypothetical protein